MNLTTYLEQQQDMALLQPYFTAVRQYLGLQPDIAKFYKYTDDEWTGTFGNDHEMLLGRTAAVFGRDRSLHVRQDPHGEFDKDGTLLHEVVHSTGFDKLNVSRDVNEGMTQIVTEEIGRLAKIKVAPTYHQEVVVLKKFVMPLVGMDLNELARGYAQANDPAMFLAGLIWSRYWHFFQDRNDWGDLKKTQQDMVKMFKGDPFNGWPYLEHIYEELRSPNRPAMA